jgi:hypothetical protein
VLDYLSKNATALSKFGKAGMDLVNYVKPGVTGVAKGLYKTGVAVDKFMKQPPKKVFGLF